jgi:hypothetical protein
MELSAGHKASLPQPSTGPGAVASSPSPKDGDQKNGQMTTVPPPPPPSPPLHSGNQVVSLPIGTPVPYRRTRNVHFLPFPAATSPYATSSQSGPRSRRPRHLFSDALIETVTGVNIDALVSSIERRSRDRTRALQEQQLQQSSTPYPVMSRDENAMMPFEPMTGMPVPYVIPPAMLSNALPGQFPIGYPSQQQLVPGQVWQYWGQSWSPTIGGAMVSRIVCEPSTF